MRIARLAPLVLAISIACGSSSSTIGPLSIEPPKGWLVTDRESTSIKVTNGTVGDETGTKAGTATAVFDVFVAQDQGVDEFREILEENNVKPKEEQLKIDGYAATILSYRSNAFGPSTELVFIPDWRVRIVYRAAYPTGESAFARYRSDFRKALDSISFSGRPPNRA